LDFIFAAIQFIFIPWL